MGGKTVLDVIIVLQLIGLVTVDPGLMSAVYLLSVAFILFILSGFRDGVKESLYIHIYTHICVINYWFFSDVLSTLNFSQLNSDLT